MQILCMLVHSACLCLILILLGDRARLGINLNPTYTGMQCSLRFWVHMLGDDVEKLRVLTRTHVGGTESEVLNLRPDQSQYRTWTLVEVPLSSSAPFQVRCRYL